MNLPRFPLRPVGFIGLLAAVSLSAEISMPAIFSDHMVLQRDQPIALWGEASPGESVTARFADASVSTKADAEGAWSLQLPTLETSFESRTLTVEGENILTFEDVLVGEVWLCSGQSNMEKPLGKKRGQRPTDNYLTEVAAADFPSLRLFQVPRYGTVKKPEVQMRWLPTTPENLEASEFSAAGYYFGRELIHNLDTPVGLIHSSFGGTMVEAWTPREAIEAEPALKGVLENKYFAWVDGVQATELWQSMLTPLVPYSLRGFLWYQGEANAMTGETSLYTTKLAALVDGWRSAWNAPEAPFYYVQLAPFEYSAWDSFPAWLTPCGLPLFWEAQTAALEAIPHSGMIVTTDLAGDAKDIHPTNKRDVGIRLGHLALQETYGDERRPAQSPRLLEATVLDDEGEILLTFDAIGDGLRRADGQALTYFEIAGKSRQFQPAEARLVGKDTIRVSSSLVRHPVAVRFAWNETASPNLVNSAGLPPIPFRTDDWPVANTQEKPVEVENP